MAIQTDFGAANGADLSFVSNMGLTGTPSCLRSILYERSGVAGINIIVKVLYNGKEYVIDKVSGTTERFYVFPNQRVPNPIDLHEKAKVAFVTEGVAAGTHSVMINWKNI